MQTRELVDLDVLPLICALLQEGRKEDAGLAAEALESLDMVIHKFEHRSDLEHVSDIIESVGGWASVQTLRRSANPKVQKLAVALDIDKVRASFDLNTLIGVVGEQTSRVVSAVPVSHRELHNAVDGAAEVAEDDEVAGVDGEGTEDAEGIEGIQDIGDTEGTEGTDGTAAAQTAETEGMDVLTAGSSSNLQPIAEPQPEADVAEEPQQAELVLEAAEMEVPAVDTLLPAATENLA